MSKSIIRLIQATLSVVLLVFVAWQAELFSPAGRGQFLALLADANLLFLTGAVAIGVVVNMSSSLKWWMLSRVRNLQAGYWRIFSYYLIGQFYNLFLPTSVGGDVVRSYQLGKHTGRQADAMASVFVERYTGILVLLLLSGLAVLSQLAVFSNTLVLVSLVFFSVALLLMAWMIFDPRVYNYSRDLCLRIAPVSGVVFTKLDKLLASIQIYKEHPSAIVWAFINSLVFYFLAVVNVYITARVFEFNVSFGDMLIATPIIMLVMNLPVSIGNVGLMEVGYQSVFVLFGYSPALGVAVALLMRLKSLVDGAMGGVLQAVFVEVSVPDKPEN